jgi:acyl dehydratase
LPRRYGLTARDRFPARSRPISTLSGGLVAHANLCVQLCFECLAEGLALSAFGAGTQLRIRFLRPVFVGDEVAFEVTSATERPGVLFVEGECKVGRATVVAVAARIPRAPVPPD